MKSRPVLDVSQLSTVGFGPRAPLWWGVLGLIAIESTMFALLIASYFYLRLNFKAWPPPNFGFPDLGPGTANMILLLVSVWPMLWVDRAAKRGEQRPVQIGMIIGTVIGIVSIVLRVYEFPAMKCRWDSHAYGSVVWTGLGLHTMHLVTSTLENLVLTIYAFVRELDPKHQLDLEVNSVYWFFVVFGWLPVYIVIYFAPRWLN
jgi:cytochrome c oxidase subunit III